MVTKTSSIVMILICTIVSSFGQILFKIGASNSKFDFGLFTNYALIAGLFIYALCGVVMVIALKNGELSVLYPIMSLNFVWVSILSTILLPIPETMNVMKWTGVFIIVIGVSSIGFSTKLDVKS